MLIANVTDPALLGHLLAKRAPIGQPRDGVSPVRSCDAGHRGDQANGVLVVEPDLTLT
jgi:hypothetical protein